MDEDKFVERIDSFMIKDVPPDASLNILKAANAEIAKVSKHLVKAYLIKKQTLTDKKRVLLASERIMGNQINDEFLGKGQKDRLDKDGRKTRIETIVNGQEGTQGIYEEIHRLEGNVDVLDTIIKTNKLISDKIDGMMTAEVNIKKIEGQRR